MDSGEVIPGLNEGWNFMGARLMEWCAGLIMAMLVGSAFRLNPATSMPILVTAFFGVTFGLASMRKKFPDEEKGLANHFMSLLGFPPPKIPKPAILQPVWSGAPIKEISEHKDYSYLDLQDVFDLIEKEKAEEANGKR